MSRTLAQLKKDKYENLTEEEISSFKEVWSILHNAVNNTWPNQYKEAFDNFLKHFGWHIRLDMSTDDLIPFIKKGSNAVDDFFIKQLRHDRSAIRRQACEKFPHRKEMINSAFNAHSKRNYLQAVPLFLMLSEGIFREISGLDLFSKNSKKTVFIKSLKVDKKVTLLISHIIEAVTNGDIIGLRFDNDEYLKYPNVLSRNKILHGADYTYGNATNAYKALSQFEFVIESIYIALNDGNI